MKIAGIYRIQLIGTTKCYIGSSMHVRARLDRHRSALRAGNHHSSYLQNAWNAYGESAFEFSIVEEGEPTKAFLQKAEQRWLDKLEPCYNMLKNAYSHSGFKLSAEARAKIAASNAKRPVSAETREKMSLAKKGKPLTPEHKEKVRQTVIGREKSAETRKKLSEAHLGKKFSEEHRLSLSKAWEGRRLRLAEKKKAKLMGILTNKVQTG